MILSRRDRQRLRYARHLGVITPEQADAVMSPHTHQSRLVIMDYDTLFVAHEDKPDGRALAVLQRPRPYSGKPFVITNVRTGEQTTRTTFAFAKVALRTVAHREYLHHNPAS